jgi:peptide/nickel transport system substrate-binding protein
MVPTRRPALAAALAALALAAPAGLAEAKPLRYAVLADAATLDPHANNAQTTFIVNIQIYEPLVARDRDLKIIPGLATRWEAVEPTRWRFFLRPGVKFHAGETMTADDVVFSFKRALAPTSNVTIYLDSVADIVKVDGLTVDIVTKFPDVALPGKISRIFIASKAWMEANKSERPQNFREKEETYASRNTNGTGPYMLRSREPDVRTVLVRNPNYWGPIEGNVTEWIHTTITSDATRISALLAGDIDFSLQVPFNDIERLSRDQRVRVLPGQENRTVFLAMDQKNDELTFSNVKGKNPFKDVRVRQAIAHAIDINAIKARVLRNQAIPTGSMWTHYVNGFDEDVDKTRLPFDRDKAKKLMAEAGYASGFQVTLDCPVGQYDEVCIAIAPMLAQIGIDLKVNTAPAGPLFQKIARGETSMYALSWGVPTFDAMYTLRGIIMTKDKVGGSSWNHGNYSNPKVDALIEQAQVAPDADQRRRLMVDAHKQHNADLGHIALYHMMSPWAASAKVTAPHRADNLLEVKWVKID